MLICWITNLLNGSKTSCLASCEPIDNWKIRFGVIVAESCCSWSSWICSNSRLPTSNKRLATQSAAIASIWVKSPTRVAYWGFASFLCYQVNSLYRALGPLDSCRVLRGQAVGLVTYPILFGRHKIHCPQRWLFGNGLLASEVVEFAVGFLPRTGLYYFLAHQWSNFGWPPNSPLSQWQKDEWAVWIL